MRKSEDFLSRHRGLRKYILSDEDIVFATHRHWIRLWEPILTTTGSFVALCAIFLGASSSMRDVLIWLFWGWAVLLARFVWKYLEWRNEWLLMTSLRLMTVTGFFVQRVATMPRDKVTDLGYRTDLMGQVLGYGTFHFETAGQDQELSTVDHIPRSDALYRTLMSDLFHPAGAAGAKKAAAPATSVSTPTALPPSITPRRAANDDAPELSTPRTHRIRIRPAEEV